MREAGEVCYADVDKNGGGTGVVEFQHRDDMKYALKNLDDTKFKSHEVCEVYNVVTTAECSAQQVKETCSGQLAYLSV